MEGGPPWFGPGFTCPALLGISAPGVWGFAYGALTRSGRPSHAVPLPDTFVTRRGELGSPLAGPTTPRAATPPGCKLARVWAGPRSLAATNGISVDFSSSGYLDVSVPRVASPWLCIRHGVPGHDSWRVPPFGHLRIRGRLRLPADYRSLPRPSSASCAKASAVRP